MVRKGYNPARRNRNIGTRKSGHGQDNKMRVPAICQAERAWWGQLGEYSRVRRTVAGRDLLFIVEKTRSDCFHACTVDDVCHLLELIDTRDWELLHTFVLRQSTRKQWSLCPVWGRLAYSANLGQPGAASIKSGPAVFLEAVNPNQGWKWEAAVSPSAQHEIERLKTDGHRVSRKGKYFLFRSSLESVRNTQLYRTVLHEIGHWVDWIEKVVRPSRSNTDHFEKLEDLYYARLTQEGEAFAHRYADSVRERLQLQGMIPYPRIVRVESMEKDGLDRQDFTPTSSL